MLMPKKISQKRLTFYIIFIVVLVLISLYLLYKSFLSGMFSQPSSTAAIESPVNTLVVPAKELKFSDDFVNKPVYRNLKAIDERPLAINQLGRTNPFEPISFNSTSTNLKK